MTRQAVRGRLVWFRDDPAIAGTTALVDIEDGIVVIEAERIAAVGPAAGLLEPGLEVSTYPNALILPGLIDAHIHYPQTRIIGSYGTQLLDWLNRYTFPAERRFADPAHCADTARFFLDELLRNGTTTAVAYASAHPCSVDALCAEAQGRNMRLITGKVMMDDGPEGLRDTAQSGYDDSKALIARWHGQGRLGYAITPRFALTSSAAQLAAAGTLLREHPDCWLQTHLAENHAEIAEVARRFPESSSYTDVYDRFGLLGPRSIFGHCLHLAEAEIGRLAATGSIACFCPTSNLFIGSGLFDLARLTDRPDPVRMALATDVGGGTSYSMLQTAAEAYKVLQLQNQSWPALDAFHTMTLGNAQALGLAHEIGTLEPDTFADLAILDLAPTPAIAHRLEAIDAGDLPALLFALMMMGDDRTIRATWVAGEKLHERPAREQQSGQPYFIP